MLLIVQHPVGLPCPTFVPPQGVEKALYDHFGARNKLFHRFTIRIMQMRIHPVFDPPIHCLLEELHPVYYYACLALIVAVQTLDSPSTFLSFVLNVSIHHSSSIILS